MSEYVLNNGYHIQTCTLDGKPSLKLLCPNCKTWGFIDDDQFSGRVSIDCSECDFHKTINIRDNYLETRGYDLDELENEGVKLFHDLLERYK